MCLLLLWCSSIEFILRCPAAGLFHNRNKLSFHFICEIMIDQDIEGDESVCLSSFQCLLVGKLPSGCLTEPNGMREVCCVDREHGLNSRANIGTTTEVPGADQLDYETGTV